MVQYSPAMDVRKKIKAFRFSPDQIRRLQAYAAAAGLTETELVERALERYLGPEAEAVMEKRLADIRKLNKSGTPPK